MTVGFARYSSTGKLNTPAQVDAFGARGGQPINSGGTALARRVFQRSRIDCIFIEFQAITRLASRLNASATVGFVDTEIDCSARVPAVLHTRTASRRRLCGAGVQH